MTTKAKASPGKGRMFTFGEPESVLDRRDVALYAEAWRNGRWYEPPVAMRDLARLLNVNPHHRSAIDVKRNLLVSLFVPSSLLSRGEFSKWANDFLWAGNGYVERVDSIGGRPMALRHSMAINTKRGLKDGEFFFVNNRWDVHEFKKGSVFQLIEHDACQEIYGLPGYLSAMQSALLNEESTLFRRRYFKNGAHAGFVFYLNEETIDDTSADEIEESLKGTKGKGNFRNIFIHAPKGKKDGVQIIPIGDASAKDEFLNIKNTTRDDILAAHRVPPQLLGVVPSNTGGFGDVEKAESTFMRVEILPLQARFLELNEWLGVEAVAFVKWEPPAGAAAA
ncbi:phage portal protein [Asticcacaulis sp. AC460]|uniref:phage portal protein n=1 Tax=Asticcacaulis sp. AC460 TaxID=1282360 RepID=UPI0004CF4677|nr:phage portal protein [Asticcacaulis sp. AC460]